MTTVKKAVAAALLLASALAGVLAPTASAEGQKKPPCCVTGTAP